MDFTRIKVLVLDGGARQALSIVHGLKEIGCYIAVVCSSKLDVCYVSRFPNRKIYNPNAAGSYDGFESFLEDLLKKETYDVIIPVAEITTNRITAREDFWKKFARLACAPRDAYIQAFDKQRTFENAMAVGIPCPNTRRSGQDIYEYIHSACFPVIIKPRSGLGSIGFKKFNEPDELVKAIENGSINPDNYVIQEFVHFKKRYSTHVFMDGHGTVNSALAVEVLRWYPVDAGTAVVIRTIDCPEVIDYSCKLLRHMNWAGLANPSFMIDEDTGKPYLLEINGRIPASIKMSFLCGFNISKMLLELAFGEKVTIYPENKKFGLVTRHSQADLLWFLKSPDRFRADPSWFSWKNANDIVFWANDPLPFFAYSIRKLLGVEEAMNKRKHI